MESWRRKYPAESAHLVRSLLETYRRNVKDESTVVDPERGSYTWLASRDFTVAKAKMQIGEYIQTWNLPACWLHSIDFICTTEEEFRIFHHYRARFSTPSPGKPILGTASVFFAVDLSKVKPKTLPVQVHFVVESNRLVHTPGRTRFREKWLQDVIDSKTLLKRRCSFEPDHY